ncbi:MAG TPA: hypothetical protein VNX28_02855 [Gemmataceae bacterium]|jgi:hypothetical protein|nr:hypothetical protein [Gemmataceae bacterium]
MPKATKEDFKKGLRKVKFGKNHRKMLQSHYGALDHTRTATQIGERVGWEWNTVNLRYGIFVNNLAVEMYRPDEAKDFQLILKSALKGPIDGQLKLVMCEALVEALDDLC